MRSVRLREATQAVGTGQFWPVAVSRTGGIRPSPRRRSALALELSEREEISRGVMARRSMRTMARALGRAASTVSREIRRNGGWRAYQASEAEASGLATGQAAEAL